MVILIAVDDYTGIPVDHGQRWQTASGEPTVSGTKDTVPAMALEDQGKQRHHLDWLVVRIPLKKMSQSTKYSKYWKKLQKMLEKKHEKANQWLETYTKNVGKHQPVALWGHPVGWRNGAVPVDPWFQSIWLFQRGRESKRFIWGLAGIWNPAKSQNNWWCWRFTTWNIWLHSQVHPPP